MEIASAPRPTRALSVDEVLAIEREVACRYGRVGELTARRREGGLLVLACSRRSDFEDTYFCAWVAHELFGAMLAERLPISPAEVRDAVHRLLAQNAEMARIGGIADERDRVTEAVRAIKAGSMFHWWDALRAAARMTLEAAPALRRALFDESAEVREFAAEALGRLGAPAAGAVDD